MLSDGAFFGERGLLASVDTEGEEKAETSLMLRRDKTAVAATSAELCFLPSDAGGTLIKEYPQFTGSP